MLRFRCLFGRLGSVTAYQRQRQSASVASCGSSEPGLEAASQSLCFCHKNVAERQKRAEVVCTLVSWWPVDLLTSGTCLEPSTHVCFRCGKVMCDHDDEETVCHFLTRIITRSSKSARFFLFCYSRNLTPSAAEPPLVRSPSPLSKLSPLLPHPPELSSVRAWRARSTQRPQSVFTLRHRSPPTIVMPLQIVAGHCSFQNTSVPVGQALSCFRITLSATATGALEPAPPATPMRTGSRSVHVATPFHTFIPNTPLLDNHNRRLSQSAGSRQIHVPPRLLRLPHHSMCPRPHLRQEGRLLPISNCSRRPLQTSPTSLGSTVHARVPQRANKRHPKLLRQRRVRKSGRPASSDVPPGPTEKPLLSAEERARSHSNAPKREILTRSSLLTTVTQTERLSPMVQSERNVHPACTAT